MDEVHFVANTLNERDLAWLDRLTEEVPQYKRIDIVGAWNVLWHHTKNLDPDAVVIKIDDDIVSASLQNHGWLCHKR